MVALGNLIAMAAPSVPPTLPRRGEPFAAYIPKVLEVLHCLYEGSFTASELGPLTGLTMTERTRILVDLRQRRAVEPHQAGRYLLTVVGYELLLQPHLIHAED